MVRLNESAVREFQIELLKRERQAWFRILSNSMEPLIRKDDRVRVAAMNASDARTGDIALLCTDGVFVAHRLVRIIRNSDRFHFFQKGDANGSVSPVEEEAIIGKVVAVERKGMVLDLTHGSGRLQNALLAIKSMLQCRWNRLNGR